MKITAIKHKVCGDIIYSRANHDFKTCSCPLDKYIAIDGGQGNKYYRVIGNPDEVIEADFELDVTKQELYDDWNSRADKYEIIRGKK